MKHRAHVFSATILFLIAAAAAPAQEKPQGPPPAQGRGMARPIVLGPDDVRAFPDAPPGFNTRRDGPAGRIEPFEYDSRVTGTRRKANVYLPPGLRPVSVTDLPSGPVPVNDQTPATNARPPASRIRVGLVQAFLSTSDPRCPRKCKGRGHRVRWSTSSRSRVGP